MLRYFLTPPGLYYLLTTIILLSLLIFLKRKWIIREIRRWRAKELNVGPIVLERQDVEKTQNELRTRAGIRIGEGTEIMHSKLKRIAGRDIRFGKIDKKRGGATPGVEIERKVKISDSDLVNIAGRDFEENQK